MKDEDIFLGYSIYSRSYRVFNKHTLNIEKSIHVVFDDSNKSFEVRVNIDDEDDKPCVSIQKGISNID